MKQQDLFESIEKQESLDVLEAEGKIEPVRQEKGVFYQIKRK